MSKSRTFSIYLLKENFSGANALKDDHDLGKPVSASYQPDGATVYVVNKLPIPPWWKSYWGISQDFKQTLNGAIVFLPVGDRCFALTFGHTYHRLKDDSYEYDFGLRTTLNALDPEKIKSTDIFQPVNAKRERIQSPIASNLTFFDINNDESIIKKLAGSVKVEYTDILSNITGANSLRVTSKVTASDISDLCNKVLDIYTKEDFKKSFPDIQNIVPVKDPTLINTLNEKIIIAFNDEAIELVLSVPDIIEYSESFNVSYSGAGQSSLIFDNIYITNYREYLRDKGIDSTSLLHLKKHKLNFNNENNDLRKSYTIYKCLLFDCELDSKHYHLCEGEWYQVDNNYVKKLKRILDPVFSDHNALIPCEKKHEDDYNKNIANSNERYVCLDKKNIALRGNIEPCDLYTVENDAANLIHIKISTRSSSLSHLFNQGANSLKLLTLESESREKLKELLPNDEFKSPVSKCKFEIIFGIITAKDKTKKSDNLPIFSRISLQRVMSDFQLMGINAKVVFIEDLVDRTQNKLKR